MEVLPDKKSDNKTLRILGAMFWIAAFLAVVAITILTISRSVEHWDMAWILYQTNAMLDGAKPYVNFVEVNPPLIFWLTVPAAWLARVFGCDSFLTMHICQFLLVGASLLACLDVVRSMKLIPDPLRRRMFFLALTYVQLSLPGFNMGEREWIMFVLVSPYLLIVAGRLSGAIVPRRLWWIAGLAAGVGFALKPFFLLLWMGLELYLVLCKSGWFIRRPESLIVLVIQGAYFLLVLIFTPEYLKLMPMAQKLYGAFNINLSAPLLLKACLKLAPTAFVALLALPIIRVPVERRPLVRVLGLTTALLLGVALIQRKGWEYHLYPAIAASMMLLVELTFCFCRENVEVPEGFRPMPTLAVALLTVAILAGSISKFQKRQDIDAWYQKPEGQACRLLAREGRGKSVALLSTTLCDAFPTVNYTGMRYVMRYNSLWMLPGLYPDLPATPGERVYHDRQQMSDYEKQMVDTVVEDFRLNRPDFVLVDVSEYKVPLRVPFDYVEYFSLNKDFKEIWRQYEPISTDSSLWIYARRGNAARPN